MTSGLSSPVLAAFWGRLRASPTAVLMLDYDGTLAPFTPRRDQAVPYPGVAAALARLQASGRTRLVIITGREAARLMALLPLAAHLEVWGCHGLQRRLASGLEVVLDIGTEASDALRRARAGLLARAPAANLEEKPGCLALHWRGLPAVEIDRLTRSAREAWDHFDHAHGLRLHPFDGGLELRSELASKARAVAAVAASAGPDAALAYVGDDLTDEEAFAALPPHGLGVLVQSGSARSTAAQLRLQPPADLLAFLGGWESVTLSGTMPELDVVRP